MRIKEVLTSIVCTNCLLIKLYYKMKVIWWIVKHIPLEV